MQQYGPLISYDVSDSPITMRVSDRIEEKVCHIFRENYRLPVKSVSQENGQVVFTFDESVDAATFERHLKTGSPEAYGSE